MRKRNVLAVFLALMTVFSTYSAVFAETSAEVKLMVNNKVISADTPSVNINGTILVPAKELLESLGGTYKFDYNSLAGTASANENELVFHLDDSVAAFNGKLQQATAPLKIINNRFMIPGVFSAARLGAEAYYSSKRNTLMVFQPSDGKIIYQVMSGDTLWIISQLFGTTIDSLMQLNSLTNDRINVGQKLVVKQAAAAPVLPAYTTSGATIRSGAGFSFSETGYLGTSAVLSITGKNGDWYKTISAKGSGYIYKTVVGMKQELAFGPRSGWLSSNIAVDTSMDTITYIDYTVVKGDYMWLLSQKYGIPDYELAAANNITASTVLYPGQKLKIPVHNIAVKKTSGPQYGEVLDWFSEAQYLFPIGKTGKLTDPVTGKSFWVKRTIGASHSDTETLTAQDSTIMKEIFGGNWSWNKKPFILEFDGRRFAVSVSGMPHAGVDGVPFLQDVANRSDNYGTGPNYDSISGNSMDGHFDLYFLNSMGHSQNVLDEAHQYNVLTMGGLR